MGHGQACIRRRARGAYILAVEQRAEEHGDDVERLLDAETVDAAYEAIQAGSRSAAQGFRPQKSAEAWHAQDA